MEPGVTGSNLADVFPGQGYRFGEETGADQSIGSGANGLDIAQSPNAGRVQGVIATSWRASPMVSCIRASCKGPVVEQGCDLGQILGAVN